MRLQKMSRGFAPGAGAVAENGEAPGNEGEMGLNNKKQISVTMINGDIYEFPFFDGWRDRLSDFAQAPWLSFLKEDESEVIIRASNIVAIEVV